MANSYNFDVLQMYFMEPYVIDLENAKGSIKLIQPTIGDIVRLGQERFFATLNIFITNTTANRLMLWNIGIDWNEISDFELFTLFYKNIDGEISSLLFEDVNFSQFEAFDRIDAEGNKKRVLYDEKNDVEINEDVYKVFSEYFRFMFKIFPEEKKTSDATMKKWFIQKDERELKIKKEKEERGIEKANNGLMATISACINHPGFKYKVNELREVGVCQFYDSVQRLQIYENTTACMKGLYSGMVDSSKIPSDSYNFMKEI